MEITKTKRIVLSSVLAALGMILGLLEIPYPLAPWLNLDLSEIVVIMAISMLGFKSALFVCGCKFFVSILFKGPVGPIAIGQITALISSLTICCVYYFLSQHLKLKREWLTYVVNMFITMIVFATVLFILNYLFVTPTYLMQKPTWYSDLPFALDINTFNQQYGTNISIPGLLNFLSPYGQAIFIIYFPFNFIKGAICAIVYYIVRPVESKFKEV